MSTLKTYLAQLTPEQQADYAVRAGTSIGYLRKALSIGQRFGGLLARRLDEQSNGVVSRYDLRPDIFDPQPEPRENPYPVSTNEMEATHG